MMKWCCSCIEFRLAWVTWGRILPELWRPQAIPDRKISSLGSCKGRKWFRIWRITLFLCLVCCDYRLSISNDPEHSNQPAFPGDLFSCFSQESMLPPEDPRSFYRPTTSHTNCIYMNPIESTSLLGVQSGEYSPNFDQESVWSSHLKLSLTISARHEPHNIMTQPTIHQTHSLDPKNHADMWYICRFDL